ncbi:uncharacterized protein LOC110448987 [Mizuhopecten yessoensis]|uniref:A disintegrin and metalloproteinase with thrombospondin motifs 9 n=1 Tax=Mizuhopecten yessoensis TaxID=6573 RepID=A0A210QS72_MIZYE|nr:uncharacterized protein LOC110448987 [Mizuhopecten yessoensis]OWF51576.1 A disintegrin and metalloproteinase with thrombospondin motifs 9 [Mizuhopecten yessoensis]
MWLGVPGERRPGRQCGKMEILNISSIFLVFLVFLANTADGTWLAKSRGLRSSSTDKSGKSETVSTKMQQDWSNLFDRSISNLETHLITESNNMLEGLFKETETEGSVNKQTRNDLDDLMNQINDIRRNMDTMSNKHAQLEKRMGSALRARTEKQHNTMNIGNMLRDLNEMSSKLAGITGSVSSLTERAGDISLRNPEVTRPADCQAVKNCNSDYGNGEYYLYPTALQGQRVKVYCNGMHGPDPKEYITLLNTNTATYNFSLRYDNDYCLFRDRVGDAVSTFHKIRIKIEDMSVQRYDLSFADTIEEAPDTQKAPKFGSGGGCSWDYMWRRFEQCTAPGGFVIDTSGTGLVVDPHLQWTAYGYGNRVDTVHRSKDNSHVTAACDGWCAWCYPRGQMFLQLAPEVGLIGDATEPVCT